MQFGLENGEERGAGTGTVQDHLPQGKGKGGQLLHLRLTLEENLLNHQETAPRSLESFFGSSHQDLTQLSSLLAEEIHNGRRRGMRKEAMVSQGLSGEVLTELFIRVF